MNRAAWAPDDPGQTVMDGQISTWFMVFSALIVVLRCPTAPRGGRGVHASVVRLRVAKERKATTTLVASLRMPRVNSLRRPRGQNWTYGPIDEAMKLAIDGSLSCGPKSETFFAPTKPPLTRLT